jgi:hypothetical protein
MPASRRRRSVSGVALPHPLKLGLQRLDALLQLGQAVPAAVLPPAAALGGRPVLVAANTTFATRQPRC